MPPRSRTKKPAPSTPEVTLKGDDMPATPEGWVKLLADQVGQLKKQEAQLTGALASVKEQLTKQAGALAVMKQLVATQAAAKNGTTK